jgi:hypothetical protein
VVKIPALSKIAEAHPDIVAELRKLHPVETASTFAGLLIIPKLQANCFRIEVLTHFAIAYCQGRAAPGRAFVQRAFERIGTGYCGLMEDPAEDVFVTLVNTPLGNFRIFEGIREGAGFHLQRILDVIEGMPDYGTFSTIRNSVHAMLLLSDELAERAGARENILGQEMPVESLPTECVNRLARIRDLVRFTKDNIQRLGISEELLTDFAFVARGRTEIAKQSIGHTDLERRPIGFHGSSVHLLLPTAFASAITRFVIESVLSMGLKDTFEAALSAEFAELFDQTPILGGPTRAPLRFQKMKGGRISVVTTKFDAGRVLHLMFFVDGLDGFLEEGLNGTNADPSVLSSVVKEHLERVSSQGGNEAGFLGGICLLVGCGIGRSLIFSVEGKLPENWRFETISAYDLATLSWVPDFDRFSLWRLLDSVDAIGREGAALVNVNGLLNLVAQSEKLNGHLVPHGELPDGFISAGSQSLITIPQNVIRELRQRVLIEWNPRRVLNTDGQWVRARKLSHSEFEEDRAAPLYGSEDDVRNRKLRGVYVTRRRPWWIGISAPEDAPNDAVFRLWMMLCTWLRRAAPILDDAYRALPPGPISFDVTFHEVLGTMRDAATPKSADEIRPIIQTSAQPNSPKIPIQVGKGFDDGLLQPDNVAERMLVENLVAGTAAVGGEPDNLEKQVTLVSRICPNSQARYMHRIVSRSFRDGFASEVDANPILIKPLDDAAIRIGLGWKVESRDSAAIFSGIPDCTSYLNSLVWTLLDEICAELNSLDRRSFVRQVLSNHEIAAHNRDVWSRTARANIAMHDDKDAAIRTIVRHQNELTACFVASRILLEAAICHCPIEDGRVPGRLDLSRLMAMALDVHHYGGWSDAVYWGAMEPRLRITPLGDVHMNLAYVDQVYEQFARAGAEMAVKEAVDSYAALYEMPEQRTSFEEVCGAQFVTAWAAEYGVSLNGFLAFIDRIEELGSKQPRPAIELPRSAVAATLASAAGLSPHAASNALDMFLSCPRPNWRTVDGAFNNKDWYPWRFRRRLSILRRPLIQIDSGDDPTIVIAPGLLREAFAAMVSWFHKGEIPPTQARSILMRKWIGQANNLQRSKFNSVVANKMRELGWEARTEVKLTEILGRPLDRNYGDIDVLAWRRDSERVLAIECKDVQFLKTLGEVAEQLADFRGEARSDGKPDHLKRHLNRLEKLEECQSEVSKFLGLNHAIQIEGHLVFKNPVPMQFAWDRMAARVRLSLFENLNEI